MSKKEAAFTHRQGEGRLPTAACLIALANYTSIVFQHMDCFGINCHIDGLMVEYQRRISYEAIDRLPDKLRLTVILFYFRDMDAASTAPDEILTF